MRKYLISSFLFLLTSAASLLAQGLPSYAGFSQIDCSIQPCRPSVPHVRIRESTSLNWSGYAAATSLSHPASRAVTEVQGTWAVPTLSPTSQHAYSSLWVGMDGYSDTTVEQIGTEQDWTSSGQQNYAWFEMYPKGAYELVGFPVHNGDMIGAEVAYQGNDIFRLTIVNYTRNVFFIVPSSFTKMKNALRNSAEWIVEAPSSSSGVLPLANFGQATFTGCSATINGTNGPIKQWKTDALTMTTKQGITKALPSSLSPAGTGFSVTWEHS